MRSIGTEASAPTIFTDVTISAYKPDDPETETIKVSSNSEPTQSSNSSEKKS